MEIYNLYLFHRTRPINQQVVLLDITIYFYWSVMLRNKHQFSLYLMANSRNCTTKEQIKDSAARKMIGQQHRLDNHLSQHCKFGVAVMIQRIKKPIGYYFSSCDFQMQFCFCKVTIYRTYRIKKKHILIIVRCKDCIYMRDNIKDI